MPYLLLSISPPPPRSIWRPSSFFDLGHVDILLWDPPGPPRSYGFYVSKGSRWRIFLSLFRPQAARMIVSERFAREQTHWRAWPISAEQLARLRDELEEVVQGCPTGRTRYRALRFNCFHLAHRCLVAAGRDPGELPAHRSFTFRTLGADSFLRGPMSDAERSAMEVELARDPRKAGQWGKP